MPILVFTSLLLAEARADEAFEGQVYYLGDIHAHTSVSGDAGDAESLVCENLACGVFDDLLATARANNLDFVAFTDHTNAASAGSTENYALLTDMALAGHSPETGLVTIPAAELALSAAGNNLGHKTLLLFGSNEEIDGLTRTDTSPSGSTSIDIGSCDALWTFMEGLEARFGPALLVPHHPAGSKPSPTRWTCHSDRWQPVVEVYSNHGNSMGDGSGFDPMWSTEVPSGTVHSAISPAGNGYRLGFAGGTDRHDTLPGEVCLLDQVRTSHPYGGGLTVAVVPEAEVFDRDTLYDAFVERRVYATSGPLVPVAIDYAVDGEVIATLGADLDVDAGTFVDTTVRVPTDWAPSVLSVLLWTPDGPSEMNTAGDETWTLTMPAEAAAGWLYAEVQLDGGLVWTDACDDGGANTEERLWISPSYVTVWHDEDGDGFTVRGGDCDDADPDQHPDAPDEPYDGVVTDCDASDEYDADGDGEDALAHGGTDCDDADPAVFAAADEVWYDGVDADCDGASDYDADGDGVDAVPWGGDCDDADADVHPGAVDRPYDGVVVDCDGSDEYDVDRDGHAAAGHGGDDCDDLRADVNPSQPERWYSGVDEDCDGNDQDRDGDGVVAALDCDDADASVGHEERCAAEPPKGCASVPVASWAWLLALGALRGRRSRGAR